MCVTEGTENGGKTVEYVGVTAIEPVINLWGSAGTLQQFSLGYGRKGVAVDVTWAKSLKAVQVLGGAVAFVSGKAVAGIFLFYIYHYVVAGYLGDDRGAGDGKAQFIAINYGLLG